MKTKEVVDKNPHCNITVPLEDPALRAALDAQAQAADRSTAAEIRRILRHSVFPSTTPTTPTPPATTPQ